MKVVVVSSTVFAMPLAGYGGLEAIAWHCARGLAKKGHQVQLVAPDGSYCDGVEIVPTGVAGQHDEMMAYGGYGEHKEKVQHEGKEVEIVRRRKHEGFWQVLRDADVVIDHSWMKWAYLAKSEGVTKAPVLGVMHAPVRTMYPAGQWPPHYPGFPPVEKACVVCISEDQARQHREFHETEARVCYNGIDLDFYKPIEGTKRSDRFLFLARFSTIKGPDLAIEACKQAGVGLDLVGDMAITQEPELFERCKKMCDGKQIRMIGAASRGECVWWFSQAHALLHPNQRFREPFGLAPVEAMACGCPVIAWDYGAMRETVEPNKECGFLVRSVEDFNTCVGAFGGLHAPLFDGWRKQCREQASKFSIDNMVNRYEELCIEAKNSGGW